MSNTKLKKHEFVTSELLKDIEKGLYKSGDIMPGDFALSKKYNVSRIVVRQAVDTLVKKGYVTRMIGVGTLLNSTSRSIRVLNEQITSIEPYGDEVYRKELDITEDDIDILREFNPKSKIDKFEILKEKKSKPFVLMIAYFNRDGMKVFDKTGSEYFDVLNKELYIAHNKENLSYIKEKIWREKNNVEIRKKLQIIPHESYIVREYRAYSKNDELLYVFKTYYSSNDFKYEVVYQV